MLELVTDDTNLTPDSDTLSTDDIFTGTPDFGNDGPNQDDPITYALRLVVADPLLDPDSGLVDTATGKAILLKVDGNDIVGIVDEDDSGTIDGTEALVAIRYSLSTPAPLDLDTEDVTFTQYRAVEHDDTSDPNESTSPETINALAEGNKQYEEKFGYIFIVCATGNTAEEMLATLQTRLQNNPEVEIEIAADEQNKITKLRIEKLVE